MNHLKRIIAAALAAAMLGGLAMPAAAQSLPEKEETVYVVLNPDGSAKSLTVSEHLYNADGLNAVTDRSSLQNIVNTQSDAAFAQNGEELVWNTADTDVYYKGETDRTPPVTADIRYTLDGRAITAEELAGQSGHLVVTVLLTNHETASAEINGAIRQVCTPFVTVVGAMLNDSFANVRAEDGTVQGDGGTQLVGFVCLPGVRACVADLLPEQLDSAADYLLDSVSFEADVTDFEMPSIMIACATDTDLLEEDGLLGELDDLDQLQEDMDALADAMDELIDGASQLNDGAAELNDGAAELDKGAGDLQSGAAELDEGAAALQDGAGTLNDGAAQLKDGADQVNSGAASLNSGAASARDGAAALKDGADALSAGLAALQEGSGQLASGYTVLKAGSSQLNSGLATLDQNSVALNNGATAVADNLNRLNTAVNSETGLAAGSDAFSQALSTAAAGGQTAMTQLLTPDGYQTLLSEIDLTEAQTKALLTAYTGAYNTASGLNSGLAQLGESYTAIDNGIQQVAGALAGSEQATGLADGASALSSSISQYTSGVATAAEGAATLDAGLAQLGESLPGLTEGVIALADGANELAQGAGSLKNGNAALADGAAQLAAGTSSLADGAADLKSGAGALKDGTSTLKDGTGQLKDGASTLKDGTASLKDGAAQLHDGTGDLLDGVHRLNDEGISKLLDSIDAEQLQSLKEMLDLMKQRQQEYVSFAGAPENAAVSVRFVMKTAETVTSAAAPAEAAEAAQPAAKTSLWQKLLALFGLA